MTRRNVFTNITPLPEQISRETAIAMLHNHSGMIELNRLVIEHHPIQTPRNAPVDEFFVCHWEELTERINYLPKGVVKGKVSYKVCFYNLPTGLQTHVYGPVGIEIRQKWTICGSLPGEPPEPIELGLKTPRMGLYVREDIDVKCKALLMKSVVKNLEASHKLFTEKITKKAQQDEEDQRSVKETQYMREYEESIRTPCSPTTSFTGSQSSSQMPTLQNTPIHNTFVIEEPLQSPIVQKNSLGELQFVHPAYREDYKNFSYHSESYKYAKSQMSPIQNVNYQQLQLCLTDMTARGKEHQQPVSELEDPTRQRDPPSLDGSSTDGTSYEDQLSMSDKYLKPPALRFGSDRKRPVEYPKFDDEDEEDDDTSAVSDAADDIDAESRYSVHSDVSELNSSRFIPAYTVYKGHSAVSSLSEFPMS